MKTGCKFCDKAGLPILLTRYAVVPKEAKLKKLLPNHLKPKLKKDSGDPDRDYPQLDNDSAYGMQILRPGYIYQYDEKSQFWTAYKVLEGGYLYRLSLNPTDPDPEDPKQHDDPNKQVFSCFTNALDASLAVVVTVPNPDEATNVWFAYAETLWTKRTFRAHNDPAYRKKNMRLFDVAAWRTDHHNVQFAAPLEKVTQWVAEYQHRHKVVAMKLLTSTSWSAFNYYHRLDSTTHNLLENCKALVKDKEYPPALLGLDDPTGILQQIAHLMDYRFHQFNNEPQRKRNVAAAGSINMIKKAVSEMAEAELMYTAKDNQEQYVQLMGGFAFMTEASRKTYEDMGNITKNDLKKAGENAWKNKYQKLYDEPAKNNFEGQYQEALKAFDQKCIAPLAKAHASLLNDKTVHMYFELNHDRQSIHSGIAYLATYVNSIKNVQDKPAIAKVLKHQLDGKPGEPASLATNALTLNNDKLIETIKGQIKTSVNLLHIPWAAITDAFKAALGTAEEASQQAAVKWAKFLVTQVAAPLMEKIDHVVGKGIASHLPLILGMLADAPIVKVEVTGSAEKFIAHLTSQIYKLSGKRGKKIPENVLKRAIADEIKKLGIRGVDLKGTKKKIFAILVDEDLLRRLASANVIPHGWEQMSYEQRAKTLVSSLRSVEHLDALNLEFALEHFKLPGKQLCVTGVSVLLQGLMIWKLQKDIDEALTDDKEEATWRYRAGCVALGGFIGEGLEVIGKSLVGVNIKWMQGANGIRLLGAGVARLGGSIAGAILAYWDVQAGIDELEHKNFGMAFIYFASAVSGFFTAVLFAFCEVVPIFGWICLAVLLIATVLIELFHKNNMQKWLARCVWGRETEGKYDEDKEAREFEIAMGG